MQTDAAERPVYFFFHVPKCAGRTIDRHLRNYMADGHYLRTQKRKGVSRFLTRRYTLDGLGEATALDAVSGHMLGASVEQLCGTRGIRRALLLRDPVSHFVSYYNFRMERYIRQGLQPYSFELAYRATRRDFITHFILRNFLELPFAKILVLSDAEKWELVNAFLSSFWYVADYRACGDLVASFASDLGVPPIAIPQNMCSEAPRHANWSPVRIQDLPDSMLRRIRDENCLDQRLWETWRNARQDVAAVQPELHERSRRGRLAISESSRLLYQIRRRAARRWALPGGELVGAASWDESAPQLG